MLNDIEQFSFAKSGQQVLQFSLSRSSKGLILRAKTHASIEDFFQTLSQGVTQPVSLHGRYWRPVSAETPLPPIYQLDQQIRAEFEGRNRYTLNNPGQELIIDGRGRGEPAPVDEGEEPYRLGGQLINLSWLRLRGISEGEGISICVPTVQTADAVRALGKNLRGGVKQFYIDFLKPVEVVITMSTQEVR